MTCEVPEKMLTAFQVVFVRRIFLLRTRPVVEQFWPLRPHVHPECHPSSLRKTKGVWWGGTCTPFLLDLRVAAAGCPVGRLALGAPWLPGQVEWLVAGR